MKGVFLLNPSKIVPESDLNKYPEHPRIGRKAWTIEPLKGDDSIKFNPNTGHFERYFKVTRNGRG